MATLFPIGVTDATFTPRRRKPARNYLATVVVVAIPDMPAIVVALDETAVVVVAMVVLGTVPVIGV